MPCPPKFFYNFMQNDAFLFKILTCFTMHSVNGGGATPHPGHVGWGSS